MKCRLYQQSCVWHLLEHHQTTLSSQSPHGLNDHLATPCPMAALVSIANVDSQSATRLARIHSDTTVAAATSNSICDAARAVSAHPTLLLNAIVTAWQRAAVPR